MIALHLHDNDAAGDQHVLPFEGSFDWAGFGWVLGSTAYRKPLNLEVGAGKGAVDDMQFLKTAYRRADRVRQMMAGKVRLISEVRPCSHFQNEVLKREKRVLPSFITHR